MNGFPTLLYQATKSSTWIYPALLAFLLRLLPVETSADRAVPVRNRHIALNRCGYDGRLCRNFSRVPRLRFEACGVTGGTHFRVESVCGVTTKSSAGTEIEPPFRLS